jgi:glutamyl endopeptidase
VRRPVKDKADPGPEGLEAVEGHKRIVRGEPGPESAVAFRARTAKLFTPPERGDLRDIGEASFGPPPPMPETVHGPDDRVRITATASYPSRAIASVVITAADNSTWIGTAWFISPRTLITAGHCVYIKNSGVAGRDGWVKKISVMPGRNGSSLPFGSITSTVFRTVHHSLMPALSPSSA